MGMVVLCDFDGTVVDIDTAEFLLERFADGDWREVDRQCSRGEISLEECMQRQFAMLHIPPERMVREIDSAVTLRPSFDRLVAHCLDRHIHLAITSAGLDFYIHHFLERRGWGWIEVIAPRVTAAGDGVRFVFPELRDRAASNFKEDTVRYHRQGGGKVAYIGDGPSDYPAAREAAVAFAVSGSRLASLLRQSGIPHHEFSDFSKVVEVLERLDGPMPGSAGLAGRRLEASDSTPRSRRYPSD